MKNTFGNAVTMTVFGESHGEAVGAVLDGLSPGIPVDEELISESLALRRPEGELETARREPDRFRILSGVFQGKTTGTPLCIEIPNTDVRSGEYAYGRARPSHADYAAFCKYHGFEDYRGGGHFSGRITAAVTAAGAVCRSALAGTGIEIGTHILRCGKASDRAFREEKLRQELELLRGAAFPVLSEESGEKIRGEIRAAKDAGDSVGGITQTAVSGLPAGLGEPWFDSVESMLSHALFGIGGIKGIEFGSGFAGVTERGSAFSDALRINEDGNVSTVTNHDGGLNGGLTNGMPVVFRCAVKPTPSIAAPKESIDFIKRENISLRTEGRHDPAIIRRICPVIDSLTAFVLCDLLTVRYGTDVFLSRTDRRKTGR